MTQLLPPTTSASEMMGLDEGGSKVGIGLMVGGGLALIAGAILYFWPRRSELGQVTVVAPPVQAGGMTLTHYRDKKLPINERLRILQDLTWQSVQDPRNRKLALSLTRNCPDRDEKCEARAIYNAVKKHVRYTGDVAAVKMGADGPVEGIDLFQSAYRTWEFEGGDCDDSAVLVATLLSLNGIPAKFRVTATKKGQDFSHIYPMAGQPKMRPTRWTALDTTLPGDRFGYEVPFAKKQDYPA